MGYTPNIDFTEPGGFIRKSWLKSLCATVRGMLVRCPEGSGLRVESQGEGGQVLVPDASLRYQVRPGIVRTQASTATASGEEITTTWGKFEFYVPKTGADLGTPTMHMVPEGRDSDQYLDFYNMYTSGPSPTAGKFLVVAWTDKGWMMITGRC